MRASDCAFSGTPDQRSGGETFFPSPVYFFGIGWSFRNAGLSRLRVMAVPPSVNSQANAGPDGATRDVSEIVADHTRLCCPCYPCIAEMNLSAAGRRRFGQHRRAVAAPWL